MLKPSFSQLVKNSPILPVLHMESTDDAINVSRALYNGGITSAEIVLRSDVAFDCITAVSEQVPEMNVGVGTLTTPQQVKDAVNAGAKFLVSPSFTKTLSTAMLDTGLPMLPGVVTPSEITQALELGINEVKFFPAQQYGGASTIKALSSVFSNVKFCPTGGVGPHNVAEYFAVKSIFAVGGSWMVPKDLIAIKDWQGITQLSTQAINLISKLDKCA
ncbi:bifunctional 4-hydroxy-2-oxoglutarate aldolase/2-dehydro-3-deoxy-phosphogluconate aldolase [Thalassotalea crassostreae]|uniref:bifunctional 4-hydroxy-2-oxoglutarate aldolase/2-dehydro-3-deoxy-phosphogluconate aldolase n=1 Tax=Thalassotalea crassostreae TaxID=1763536 RepID=UPI0008382837|nr:bifunctional 4-hydroxy-2-oxoglutarate aldolase/2-dehydro-3-deoxy-phosphogluconate aldolase [Thalassotalea crassostreae]